ncbi:hypothetical protein [Nonomuraea candida]|uniref:hypothetical protein n=1 Tax=Nonomuraea candida TaxID=359159 RepID=UPI0005B93D79|nr:hypothetical protein [Nonomuraea candida]
MSSPATPRPAAGPRDATDDLRKRIEALQAGIDGQLRTLRAENAALRGMVAVQQRFVPALPRFDGATSITWRRWEAAPLMTHIDPACEQCDHPGPQQMAFGLATPRPGQPLPGQPLPRLPGDDRLPARQWPQPANHLDRDRLPPATRGHAMSDCIKMLVNVDGLALLVPGDDPADIHRRAVEFAEHDDVTVDTRAAEVTVRTVRALPWCGPLCNGCTPEGGHYITVQDGTIDSYPAGLIACHVSTDEERAARAAAAEANRCETRTSIFGVDLGQCHAAGVAIIQFTCDHGCERAPQRVCAMHRDGAIETTKGTSDISVCRSCEEAGREDVLIRLLSCQPLTNDQEVTR